MAFSLPAEVPEPWPDGPKNRVDDAFQKVCLCSDSLLPLMIKRPQAVEEIILALIIDLREPKSGYEDYHRLSEDIELQYLREVFWPRGWHKGPFLNFLRLDQKYGVDTIIRLVDFATERLLEVRHGKNGNPIKVSIDEVSKHFLGNSRIYNWHRGDTSCADVIASALMALEKYLYEQIDKGKDVSGLLKQILSQAKSIAFLGLACEIGKYKLELFCKVLRPLLSLPELYLWEDYRQVYNSANAMSFVMEPSTIQKFMLEWENMDHRKIKLMNIAVHLFINEKSVETFFISFKDTLEKRLKANPDEGKITEKIKTLIPVLDRKNWKETKTSDNKNAWKYLPPKQLQEETETRLAQLGQRQTILCFPMHCRRLLDKEISLRDDEIESFWQQVKQISTYKLDCGVDDDILTSVPDCIAAGIAVLVKCHYEWLTVHSDYMDWCITWIIELIKNPPPQQQFDFPESAGNIYWDGFISEIAPILWSEDPDSKQWRKLIAELICLRHYGSMNLLMKSAYQLRFKLGKAFYQLVSLVLLHVTVGNSLQFHFRPDTKEVMKHYKKTKKKISSYKKQFIKNSLDCNMPTWASDIVNGAELIPYKPHRRGIRIAIKGIHEELAEDDIGAFYRKRPEVDLELIGNSFKDVFSIEDAKDALEQTTWLQFWEQLLVCRLAFNQCFNENGVIINVDEHEGDVPWRSDSELLQPIAKFIIGMRNTSLAGRLWKPIMNLGPGDHYFIESFLDWFFAFGFEKNHDENFMVVWKDILAFFNESDQWYANRSSTQWRNIDKVWQSLLCISLRVHFGNSERHQEAINEMKDCYCQWAKDNLSSDAYSTMYFSEFLKKPVANLIRLEAIMWIKDAANKANKWWWKEKGLVGSLAELLSFSWEHHKAEFARNKEADSGFKELLQLLVNKQHPVAIDLQARLAEHN